MADICKALAAIDKSNLPDESNRLTVLHAARALVSRLQRPHELVETLIWTGPFTLLACQIASEMGLFISLTDAAQTSQQLAVSTGTDAVLISRILRMLVSVGVVIETTTDTFIDSDISRSFKDAIGPISGIKHFWPIGAAQLSGLPQYLQDTGYCNPTDFDHSPFSHFMGGHSFWEYLLAHPDHHAHFNSYMSALRKGQAPWTSMYPMERILDSFDPFSVLCVDVGGGKGRDMAFLSQALPSGPNCSIIVQDMPEVIAEAKGEELPANVTTMGHDFFQIQPIRGARLYFMHSICHDWPDSKAEDILSKIRDAMRPGYSKLLLYETVMPTAADKLTPRMAAMDLNMMCHFAALERTEAQWKSLLAAAGMRWVAFFARPGAHQGIIEVQLSS